MNRKNIESLLTILDNVNPEEFDMDSISGLGTNKVCIIGHLWKHHHPDKEIEIIAASEYAENYTELISRKWYYIFGGIWSQGFNTIEHAKYRINKILNGYEPLDSHSEHQEALINTMK